MENGTPSCAECGTPTKRMHCTTKCKNRATDRRRREQRLADRYPDGRPPCPGCGIEIPPAANLDTKWCSSSCKEAARVAARRAARHQAMFGEEGRTCPGCGIALALEHDGHKKFCTPKCQQRHNARRQMNEPLPTRLCRACKTTFTPKNARGVYCSRDCLKRDYGQRNAQLWRDNQRVTRQAILAAKRCEHCSGSMEDVQKSNSRFCGARCRKAATYQRTKVAHKAYRDLVRSRPEFREANRGYAHRRRARQVAAQVIDLSPELVAQRMSMFAGCWMCGGSWTEVEHVKPLAKLGPHILANLRPACGPCNRSKGATWLGVAYAMSLRTRGRLAA